MLSQTASAKAAPEPFEFRHRNPLARDFVIVSRVVLLGYQGLSDSAKVTYWVVYSHDWYQEGSRRKGFVYPTIRRLARLRRISERTVQRHLSQLIDRRLLTRELRPGRPSVLYIEEPSEHAVVEYLAGEKRGGDIPVGGGVTKVSPQQEDKGKKKKISVNADEKRYGVERRRSGPLALKDLLPQLPRRQDVRDQHEWLAQEILGRLGDHRSLGCYRTIASRCPQPLVFEALSLVKDAAHSGHIRKNSGALFVAIVRRLCAQSGIRDPFLLKRNEKPVDLLRIDMHPGT